MVKTRLIAVCFCSSVFLVLFNCMAGARAEEGINTPNVPGANRNAEDSDSKGLTSTQEFITNLQSTCSSCVKAVSDFYFANSCKKETVDKADIPAIQHFMQADPRYGYLLGLLSITPSAYEDFLETCYKAKCLYAEGMKQFL